MYVFIIDPIVRFSQPKYSFDENMGVIKLPLNLSNQLSKHIQEISVIVIVPVNTVVTTTNNEACTCKYTGEL